METELIQAKLRLNELAENLTEAQTALEQAIEDANAEAMLKQDRIASELRVRIYAQKSRIMRLQKAEDTVERSRAVSERDALEARLADATKQYADAISAADERRITMQVIQAKLFGIDSRIETAREAINEGTKQLREHVARWKTDSLLPASEVAACEL
jgi:chromosome segregation ATPase